MGIEEKFRDCKSGCYNQEGSGLRGERLIKMILLITIAYSWAIFQGTEMSKKAGAKISISPLSSEKKIPETEYIGRWRKMERSGLIISIDILNLYKS